jgi:hypothetical protein
MVSGSACNNIVDLDHLAQCQVAHAGAGVDQKVAIDEERGRPAILGDGARAPQHTHLHLAAPFFV